MKTLNWTISIAGLLAVGFLLQTTQTAHAIGCVSCRAEAPVMTGPVFRPETKPWQFLSTWRYTRSDRHFVGDAEQTERTTDESQVINNVHTLGLGISRDIDERWTIVAAISYQMANRSSPIRDPNGLVKDRTITTARGFGDMVLLVNRLMSEPNNPFSSGNLRLGLGAKLPTGENNVVDAKKVLSATTGAISNTVEVVDQSIQPGDGGFGVVFDIQGYHRIFNQRTSAYFTGRYLLTPEGTSGVRTFRSAGVDAEMSIADQFIVRTGVAHDLFALPGFTALLGARFEGVPSRDLLGPSLGFRRPGYALSLEPGIKYYWDLYTVDLSIPIALYRNRTVSVGDASRNTQGDAAFADYLIIASFSMRF